MLMGVFLSSTLKIPHVRNHSPSKPLRIPGLPCLVSLTWTSINGICVRIVLRQAAVYSGGPERQLTPQMFIVRRRCCGCGGGDCGCGGGGGWGGGGGGGCVILLMEAQGTGFLRRSAGQIQSNRDDAKHSMPFETCCGTLLWPLNKMTRIFSLSNSFFY